MRASKDAHAYHGAHLMHARVDASRTAEWRPYNIQRTTRSDPNAPRTVAKPTALCVHGTARSGQRATVRATARPAKTISRDAVRRIALARERRNGAARNALKSAQHSRPLHNNADTDRPHSPVLSGTHGTHGYGNQANPGKDTTHSATLQARRPLALTREEDGLEWAAAQLPPKERDQDVVLAVDAHLAHKSHQ